MPIGSGSKVRSMVFFVSPNTIASGYYAAPGDEFGQFLREADGVFDSIVLRSERL